MKNISEAQAEIEALTLAKLRREAAEEEVAFKRHQEEQKSKQIGFMGALLLYYFLFVLWISYSVLKYFFP